MSAAPSNAPLAPLPADALPLSGVLVVDMTSLAMGPLAAQTLGDYGADVIKVEPPAGDPFRHALPMRGPGMGAAFLQLNRNKRSLAIDLKDPDAARALRPLLARADVLVSNVRPAGMAGLGLGYEDVRALNPGIIYCAAHGFSEQGPYAGRPAADDTIQAMSGLAELQGRLAGEPQLVASIVADKALGLTLVGAVLAALLARQRGAGGRFIELGMFEAMAAFVLPEHMAGLTHVPATGPSGYARLINPMRRPHRTRDGWLCVLPYTTAQWHRFFRLVGREDLLADAALADPVARSARMEELYGLVGAAMPARTTAEWVALLREADILFGEVNSPEQLLADPHLAAVGMFPEVEHPTEGRLRLLRPPVRAEAGMTALSRLPPGLGQHSREVLRMAGLDEAGIDALVRRGSVVDGGG